VPAVTIERELASELAKRAHYAVIVVLFPVASYYTSILHLRRV
jgi:hypothetical protein